MSGNFYISDGAAQSSKCQTWETPKWLFDELNDEFNFTLDAAADDTNFLCDNYFTEQDDALVQEWRGNVFCNPPYGRTLGKWVEKAANEKWGGVVVMLIPARTDTSYWRDFVFPYATEIRFIKGRLKFGNSNASAPFPSAVVIFDDRDTWYNRW